MKRTTGRRGKGAGRGVEEERRIGWWWPVRRRKYERKRYSRRDKSAFN